MVDELRLSGGESSPKNRQRTQTSLLPNGGLKHGHIGTSEYNPDPNVCDFESAEALFEAFVYQIPYSTLGKTGH